MTSTLLIATRGLLGVSGGGSKVLSIGTGFGVATAVFVGASFFSAVGSASGSSSVSWVYHSLDGYVVRQMTVQTENVSNLTVEDQDACIMTVETDTATIMDVL